MMSSRMRLAMRKTCATREKLSLSLTTPKVIPYKLCTIFRNTWNREWVNLAVVLEPSANHIRRRPWRRQRCSTVTACAKWLSVGSISVGHAHQLHLQIRYWHLMVPPARPPAPLSLPPACIPSHPIFFPDATRTGGVHCRLSTWAGAH